MKNLALTMVSADTLSSAPENQKVREEGEFTQLRRRAEDDPQRLCGEVMDVLDHIIF